MTKISKGIAEGGSPRFGRSLEGAVAPLRAAVLHAVSLVERPPEQVRRYLSGLKTLDRELADLEERTRWFAVAIILVEWLRTREQPDSRRSLQWFFATSPSEKDAQGLAASAAEISSIDKTEAVELLPYLLDPYGRTSRLDVRKDESRKVQRGARKAAGSFYTPTDVASFMTREIAGGGNGTVSLHERWMDPAVGSGIFLVTALRMLRDGGANENDVRRFASKHLFGTDISQLACDFAAMSIFAQLRTDFTTSPCTIFEHVRANFAAVDATTLQRPEGSELLQQLLPRDLPIRLICNPPYVKSEQVADAEGRLTRSLYLPFVQMAWTIANGPRDSAALVVPLAIGANRSNDHRRLRREISRRAGKWQLLFFDRQPHALFGEDAKTRSTILLKTPTEGRNEVSTSGLLKWTSKQRSSIFSTARGVPLAGIEIGRLVPKLGSANERDLYARLTEFRLQRSARPLLGKARAHEIVGNKLSADIFIAGTAYNFLNVFRNYPDKLSAFGQLSASGIHRLSAPTMPRADELTALLTSRVAFWLWHVECDGFHVPAWFLEEFPLFDLPLTTEQERTLRVLGNEIWLGLTKDVITSINAGKMTFAFRPSRVAALRREADAAIFDALGVSPNFASVLDEFEARTVSVDGTDRGSRTHSQRSLSQ